MFFFIEHLKPVPDFSHTVDVDQRGIWKKAIGNGSERLKTVCDTLKSINLQTALHFNYRGSLCTLMLANHIGPNKQTVLLQSS